MDCFIPLPDIRTDILPDAFPNPFDYETHPSCILALEKLKCHLPDPERMPKGKMYGLMIVKNNLGETGMIVAHSGNETEENQKIPFVPQVFEITDPNGFFRKEEQVLNALNQEIDSLIHSDFLKHIEVQLSEKVKESQTLIEQAKQEMKKAKQLRAQKRKQLTDEKVLAELIRESQREKSEFNRLKKGSNNEIAELEAKRNNKLTEIEHLKLKRRNKSAQVQQRIFDSYVFLNSLGEQKSATSIFKHYNNSVPPAGAGDCAAPKLLHYAYNNHLQAITMVEFWWGPSPANEIRKHGYFYPACKSKCEPILDFMLKGLRIETKEDKRKPKVEVLYHDEVIIIVNKPEGLLSVPGKDEEESVYTQVKKLFPESEDPLIVHRLDMATSGIMVLTKTKTAHENLQKQFLNHTVKKRYTALLDGIIKEKSGVINLPLCVDTRDRPRQMVNYKHGKPALTKWEVIEYKNNCTLIHFYPETGRTHQLRVHSAHKEGLNTPIVGDQLYGKKDKRMMLHAEQIEFYHPNSHKPMLFKKELKF